MFFQPLILKEMLEILIFQFGTSSSLVCCVHGSLIYCIPIAETVINPARSFGAVVVYNKEKAWEDMVVVQGILWFGPSVGGAFAAIHHQFVLRGGAARAYGSIRSQMRDIESKVKNQRIK